MITVRQDRIVYPDGEEISVREAYLPHGGNLAIKIQQAPENLQPVIQRVASEYRSWRNANLSISAEDEEEAVLKKALLYDQYRRVLDEPDVDQFDSRGALQPTALEEFCYYLYRPLLQRQAHELAVGKYDVFQGMYFSSTSFEEFAQMPEPQYPTSTIDFMIGKRVSSKVETETAAREELLYVPAVAIECKTYLDRPRFVEADYLAGRIKAGFPNCIFLVLSEFLKLDTKEVDLVRTPIDKIYVVRRAKNIDRKIRRQKGILLERIYEEAILDMYRVVRQHLTGEWKAANIFEQTGILK